MKQHERRVCSQNGEDGVLEHIFSAIGTTNKLAVEFGAGNGVENNTKHLLSQGWSTVWFDLDDITDLLPNCKYVKQLLTPDNIAQAFEQQQVPQEFDLLSIDVDGNDYHLRQALHHYRPRVCVMEYNGCYAADQEYIMPHNDNYRWQLWHTDFGASLLSLTQQADQLGYDLVYCDSRGVNAFFVRRDVNVFPAVTAQQAWVKLWWAQ